MTTDVAEAPPRWDMTNVYSGLQGEDYLAARAQLESDLAALEEFFDQGNIRRLNAPAEHGDEPLAGLLEEALGRTNALALLAETLGAFVYAFFSTDSYDAARARRTRHCAGRGAGSCCARSGMPRR